MIVEIKTKKFAFDGCHKIYLLEYDADIKEATNAGYDIFDTSKIQEIWSKCCDLKFVNTWQLETIVRQGAEDDGDIVIFKLN